ncbi:MAG: alpha/beta hydrolase [Planctomycetota bacterium]
MRVLVAALVLTLAAALDAQTLEKVALEGGRELSYLRLEPQLPEGASLKGRPLFLALPPGGQDRDMADVAVTMMGNAARLRGYLVIVPIAPGRPFFGGGEMALGPLLERLEREDAPDRARSIAAGISNGGRSALAVAAQWPERFGGIGVAPGVIPDGVEVSRLAGKPVWMRVGEKDADGWKKGMTEAAAALAKHHCEVSAGVVPGAGHIIPVDIEKTLDWLEARIPVFERVSFKAADGLPITGELYRGPAATEGSAPRPTILLCHQAGSSRGEYRRIAPRLVAMGFDALAIDQRSGEGGNAVSSGVPNETAAAAAELGGRRRPPYAAAAADIRAALDWLAKREGIGPRILWGSSYSSSLAIMIGSEREDLAAVLSFSPGEYLGDGDPVATAAAKLSIPILVVAPESERGQAEPIFRAIAAKSKTLRCDASVLHGSRTLFMGKGRDADWEAVSAFLRPFLAPKK